MFFFDTYAIIEIIKGNINYKKYSNKPFITTIYNLMELYYALLRLYDENKAEKYFEFFRPACVPVHDNTVKAAMKFRLIEMSEIATRNLPASARSKRAISEHAQKHAPHSSKMQRIFECAQKSKEISDISAGSVFDRKKGNLISYVDCIGYVVALEKNVLFLTGEKHFKELKNVEFVR